MYEGSWMIKECDRVAAGMLARELEVSGTTAAVLVRRSYDDVARARAFLAGELPAHDPFELGDMAAACETIRGAIAAGRRICVHGDYDADGICATALADVQAKGHDRLALLLRPTEELVDLRAAKK